VNTIVVFAKIPVPGQVKTRLAARIGNEAAAEGHAAFIRDILTLVASVECSRWLALGNGTPSDHSAFENAEEQGFHFISQPPGDLGQRLASVTNTCFEQGASKVLVIGTDSPTLPKQILDDAFDALDEHDVVLGPSFDGGYYLIGLKATCPSLFEGIAWSTDAVAMQTVKAAQHAGLNLSLLPFWYDVDTFEDLRFLRFHLVGFLCHDRRANGNFRLPCPATQRWLAELESHGNLFSK
jgi:rSAM/selenodomain-associated transferase 1